MTMANAVLLTYGVLLASRFWLLSSLAVMSPVSTDKGNWRSGKVEERGASRKGQCGRKLMMENAMVLTSLAGVLLASRFWLLS